MRKDVVKDSDLEGDSDLLFQRRAGDIREGIPPVGIVEVGKLLVNEALQELLVLETRGDYRGRRASQDVCEDPARLAVVPGGPVEVDLEGLCLQGAELPSHAGVLPADFGQTDRGVGEISLDHVVVKEGADASVKKCVFGPVAVTSLAGSILDIESEDGANLLHGKASVHIQHTADGLVE